MKFADRHSLIWSPHAGGIGVFPVFVAPRFSAESNPSMFFRGGLYMCFCPPFVSNTNTLHCLTMLEIKFRHQQLLPFCSVTLLFCHLTKNACLHHVAFPNLHMLTSVEPIGRNRIGVDARCLKWWEKKSPRQALTLIHMTKQVCFRFHQKKHSWSPCRRPPIKTSCAATRSCNKKRPPP